MDTGSNTHQRMRQTWKRHVVPFSSTEVTNDVINRLKTGMDKAKATAAAAPPLSQDTTQDPRQQVHSASQSERVALSVDSSGQQYLETVSAIQVRKEKDEEINANDRFWRTKLRELEARYVSSAFASENEFNKELEKLAKLIPKKRSSRCKDISAKVAECYASNPTETLRCSHVVKEFAQCVESANMRSRESA